jgi:hypothetical protein
MIVVTLVCVVVGGRIEYLRRWAMFHERQAERLVSEKVIEGWSRESLNKALERRDDWQLTTYQEITTHRQLANEYRTAMHRPWTVAKERPPPPPYMEPSAS